MRGGNNNSGRRTALTEQNQTIIRRLLELNIPAKQIAWAFDISVDQVWNQQRTKALIGDSNDPETRDMVRALERAGWRWASWMRGWVSPVPGDRGEPTTHAAYRRLQQEVSAHGSN